MEEQLNYSFLYEPETDSNKVYPGQSCSRLALHRLFNITPGPFQRAAGIPPDGTPMESTNTFSTGLVVTYWQPLE